MVQMSDEHLGPRSCAPLFRNGSVCLLTEELQRDAEEPLSMARTVGAC